MSTFILKKTIMFSCCTIIAFQIFCVAYYFLIPNMQQELTLHFQKDVNGNYLGYYFNQDHKDTICHSLLHNQNNIQPNLNEENLMNNSNEDGSFEKNEKKDDVESENKTKQAKKHAHQEIDSDLKTLCNIHMHNQRQELYFERESYQMNLRLVLFDLQKKGFGQGIIPLSVTILDRNGDSLQIKQVLHFNQNQKKRNLLQRVIESLGTKVLSILGIQVEENLYEIDQILFEKLPNTLIDLQAIIIKIEDVGIFIQNSQLIVNPILKQLRYYLYYWFYSTSIIMIFSISTYLFLVYYLYKCCSEIFNSKRTKQHRD